MSQIGKRDMAKEHHWRAVLQDWQESRLSGPEYCQQHDIKYHNLKDWRKEIRRRDQERPKNVGKNKAGKPSSSKSFPEFVPVQVVDSVSGDIAVDKTLATSEFVLEAVFPGCVLRLKDSCPVEFLSSVVAVMEGR